MKISIFVYGSWGDIRPHVVLGMALQQAGHEVQVVASKTYEAWVRARKLGFYPLSVDVNTFSKDNASMMDMNIIKQLQTLRNVLQPMFAQMALETYEGTRDSDVLMTVEFGVSLLFDVLKANKLKTILINPAPLNPTSEAPFAAFPILPEWFPFKAGYNRFTYHLLQRIQWMSFSGARKKINEQLGLPSSKFSEYTAMLAESPALTTVSRHVVQRPSDWGEQYQVTGYLIDDDPEWTAAQDLLDFLAAGEAPVYIGFGSMPDSKPEATTKILIEAIQKTGKRGIILTGWAGFGAEDVPENIHILNYAPHSWLFPKMAVVVHHGGSGTTASGFRAGVPTIIVPHNADQPFWGATAQRLGVGTAPIPRGKLTADKLAQAIQTATSSSTMRENARILSAKMQQEDSLGEAVKWVQHYLGAM